MYMNKTRSQPQRELKKMHKNCTTLSINYKYYVLTSSTIIKKHKKITRQVRHECFFFSIWGKFKAM